jgi:hypothetical protein
MGVDKFRERDFGPTSSWALDQLNRLSMPLSELQNTERLLAAVVLLSGGNVEAFQKAMDVGRVDWRDLLVAAGLANEDWPQCLERELGPG